MRRNQPCRTQGATVRTTTPVGAGRRWRGSGHGFRAMRRWPRLATAAVERAVADGQNELPPGFRPPFIRTIEAHRAECGRPVPGEQPASQFPGSSPRWPWCSTVSIFNQCSAGASGTGVVLAVGHFPVRTWWASAQARICSTVSGGGRRLASGPRQARGAGG